jgi:hypothetical protein
MEDHEIREKLDAYTKESGFSITAIASQIGIAPITLRRFLRDSVTVRPLAIAKIADFVRSSL